MFVNTIKKEFENFKIVGYINDRDRLGHKWVAEMLLNAQAELWFKSHRLYEIKVFLAYS